MGIKGLAVSNCARGWPVSQQTSVSARALGNSASLAKTDSKSNFEPSRALSSAAATTKKTQTRTEANTLKTNHAKAGLRQLSARAAQARPAVCEIIDSKRCVQNRAEAQ